MSGLNEATRALLRGEALPAKLEELRGPLLEVIGELAEELTDPIEDSTEAELRERLLGDRSQTVAIMGERGSGKSTLLAAVTAEMLREKRHLVLPIMRPDHFGEPDSVIATFLSQLWEIISDEVESGSESSVSREAVKLLADVSRGSAMARTTRAALEHGTESPADFADDFVAVSRSGVRLTSQLRQLASCLCSPACESNEARLIIVPIDDPDLARHDIIQILTDLQILSAIPGIVPLTCFSPADLNGAWLNARQRNLPEASERHLRFLLARQMEKVFPYRFRFEIEPIAPSQRSEFVPIAESVSLREKLATLRREVERVSQAIWPFDASVSHGRPEFGLRNALPDNARTLVQLWETLDAIDIDEEAGFEQIHLTIRRMLIVLTERLTARLGTPASSLVQIGPPLEEASHVRDLQIDFSGLNFFPSAISATQDVAGESLAVLRLHPIHELRAAEDQGQSPPKYKPEDYLSSEETAALLVVQEIALGSGLFEVRGSNVYLGPQDWRFLQEVELANQVTDNYFVLLPDATTLSEMYRAASLWNRLGDMAPQMSTEAMLATAIEAACLTVELDRDLELCEDYDAAFERACEVYLSSLGRGGSTSFAFVQWFERDLPFQWHSALFGGERIRSMAARHHELREQQPRQEYPHRVDATLFEGRLRYLLESLEGAEVSEDESRHSWIAGYFELASVFGFERLDQLSTLCPRWQRDSAGVRAGAATVGILQRSPSSGWRGAPYPTPEGTELQAAGIAALKRARRLARANMSH
jgi:energy-coupling factor transporter ATP-binding protein EcfA2